jgi:2-oxo-4-hydroxy-4-carboxy-5-ureidoimidazoline decarboxylase
MSNYAMDSNANPLHTANMPTAVTPAQVSTQDLQHLDQQQFMQLLGSAVEHSPWVCQRAWNLRPFATFAALYEAMRQSIHTASASEQMYLLRIHPELAGREAVAGTMTSDSNAEQGRLGLLSLSAEDFYKLNQLNQRYQARFGYPFITALRLHDSLASVLNNLETRLCNDIPTELTVSLNEICEVMRGRLALLVSDTAAAQMTTPASPNVLTPCA